MEFQMTRDEIGILLFNMNALRKHIKKGFKKNYGKRYKDVLNDYDYVMDVLTEHHDKGRDNSVILLYERDYNMIDSFINWYVSEVRKTIKKLNDDDEKMLIILENIRKRLSDHKIKKLANE